MVLALAHFDTSAWLGGLLWSAVGLAVLFLAAYAVGVLTRKHSVVDSVWGPAFALVAAITFVLGRGEGDTGRRVLVLVLAAAWGLRLGGWITWRNHGKDEDPRYTEMLEQGAGPRDLVALYKIYALQGILVLFVSLPIQVASYSTGNITSGWGLLAWVGAAVWLVGFFFETVGDYQMWDFKRDPAHKGQIMDRGLWHYTRHPNYFGDAAEWLGIWLVAASCWPGVLTVLSPVVMVLFLTKGTGKGMTEKRMADRPGFRDYAERTSGFFPLPPKQGRGTEVPA